MFLISFSTLTVLAQDGFQKELYTAEVVFKYREEIDLTNVQSDKVKKIYEEHISDFNFLKWDLDTELRKLDEFLSADKIDEKGSLAQMDIVMELEDRVKKVRLKMLIQIKNELNSKQQDQLNKLRSDSDLKGLSLVTPINENPRVMVKVNGSGADKEPLFVIKDKNGEHIVKKVGDLDPNDIEKITVLKDESAIKAYGNKGKNGVVIIELKD
jgi:TonB-dependent SusC/RagA subfamily outer membrane receptor